MTPLAHGIGEGAVGRSVLEFIPLGIEHMMLGWDHLLFITGVVIFAGNAPRAAKLVSLFALGHSLTLLVATIAGWKLNATLVDVVIALSLVWVGALGIRTARSSAGSSASGPGENSRLIPATVFGFGLIHGLGLSTRLQDLGLPDDGLVGRVIAFNVGIEIGQLSALVVVAAVGYLLLPRVNWPAVRGFVYGGLVVVGLVAATVLVLRGSTKGSSSAGSEGSACKQTDTDPPGTFAGGHPPKRFYQPGESAPSVDLEHVTGDGYLVVRYRANLPKRYVVALEDWVGQNEQAVGASDSAQKEAVTATTAYRVLRCGRFDMAAVTKFGDTWFTDVREGRAQ